MLADFWSLIFWPWMIIGWLTFAYAWGWKGFRKCADGPWIWARILAAIVAMHLPLIGLIWYSWGWHGVGRALYLVAIMVGMFAPFGLGLIVITDIRQWWHRART